MRHILLKVVNSDKEIRIARLQAICVEKLFNQLNVAYI